MSKLLRLKDRVLLGLAIGGDILEDLVGGGSRAYHHGKLWFWTPKDYQRKSYNSLVKRMLQTGEIEKIVDRGEVYFRLKGQGKREILRRFPALRLAAKKWDGFWRVLIFDIPENQRYSRDRVRLKLLELGFGKIQRSVYISPHDFGDDLKEFFQAEGLWGKVLLFEARQKYLGNVRDLAAKIWELEKLNRLYTKIVDQLESQFNLKKKQDRESFFKTAHQLYLQAVDNDPFLPQELLPKDWQGNKARQLINKAVLV